MRSGHLLLTCEMSSADDTKFLTFLSTRTRNGIRGSAS